MNFSKLPRCGTRARVHFREPKRFTWGGIAGAVIGVVGGAVSANQKKKAMEGAIGASNRIAEGINYEPIDIEKLKIDAQNNAIANATASLAIEREIQPDVAATREELARQIRTDLERGGNLSPDVANQVTMAGRTIGARSGIGGGNTVPLTASLIGLKSIDLINQRRQAASNLLSANDLPIAGLDPGVLASIEVAQNAAQNQFNLAKAGVATNLVNSEAAARASQIGSTAGMTSALAGLAGKIGTGIEDYKASRVGVGDKTSYDEFVKKYGQPGQQQPTYIPVDTIF